MMNLVMNRKGEGAPSWIYGPREVGQARGLRGAER
jgi:hypothetical protein